MTRRRIALILAAVLAVTALIWLSLPFDFQHLDVESFLRRSGAAAPLLFSFLMIVGILVSPIPTSPLTLVSSKLFGIWGGLALTLASATIGATIAFGVARTLGDRFFVRFPQYQRVQGLLPRDATAFAIFFLRLPPSPTFDIVSYLAGLTRISVWQFILATFLGMIPVTATLCLVGSVTPTVWLAPGCVALLLFWLLRLRKRTQSKSSICGRKN